MINNIVENKDISAQPGTKPDEQFGILIEAKIKIFDPETNEIFIEKRA